MELTHMPRDLTINIYHEHEITDLLGKHREDLVVWCEDNLVGKWNMIGDSGGHAVRFDGRRYVLLLCQDASDMLTFKLSWR